MNHIDEFHSPDFHGLAQQCFAGLLLITIVTLASTSERLRTSHLLLTLFAAYSGLYASRNLPTSSLLLTLVAAPMLSLSMAEAVVNVRIADWLRSWLKTLHSFSQRMLAIEDRCRGHLWAAAGAIFILSVCISHGRLASQTVMQAHFDDQRFPVATVNFMAENKIENAVFAPDYWGGYLIYRFYPQGKVIIDDRHDFYGEAFLKSYLNVIHVQPGWERSLDAMQAKWALVPTGSSLANILKENEHWKLLHEDKTADLFQRI